MSSDINEMIRQAVGKRLSKENIKEEELITSKSCFSETNRLFEPSK